MAARGKNLGRGKGGPWPGNERTRALFERNAQTLYATLRVLGKGGSALLRAYRLTVEVPFYGSSDILIRFERERPYHPCVTVDGPSESPHRFSDGSLCMWYSHDPPSQRWVFDDGLPALIAHIQAHLFREAWWREYGEWLGPEITHAPEPAG